MRFERAEPKKRKAKPGEWFAWQNGEPAQWIGKYETISEYYILRPIPEKEEAVENDRLAKLEAEVSGHRESIAALDAEVARLRDEIQDNVSSIAETDASHEALVEEVSRLAAKVDAPKAENPRRMKSNPRCNPDSHEESKHIGEHDKLPSCDNDPKCVPVEPEPPSGEPSYPWDSAPEGTVAAAYESDTIPIWFFCRVADEGFHFRTIRIRNGASLNGCAWEKSLRVNPKFKGGK
jgi:hypothetical protein